VLRRSLWDFAQYKDPEDSNHQLHIDAAAWLFWNGKEDADDEGRLTFMHVCAVLGLDPGIIRKAAARLTRERIKRISQRIESEC
jgi:hypothetical protein